LSLVLLLLLVDFGLKIINPNIDADNKAIPKSIINIVRLYAKISRLQFLLEAFWLVLS